MFLDFTEGSLLWDWSRSPLGTVAFVTSIMVAFIIVSARHDTYSGRILALLSLAAVLFTLPLSLARVGIASDMMGTSIVAELSFLGFVLAMVCVALPALLSVLFHSINPELAGQFQGADIYGPYGAQNAPVPSESLPSLGPNQDLELSGTRSIPGEIPDRWEIEFTDGNSIGRKIQIVGKEITLGRSTGNDVVINDPYVSREHAVVSIQEGELHLKDIESTGGILVDGLRVDQSTLKSGSSIVLGRTTMRFTRSSVR